MYVLSAVKGFLFKGHILSRDLGALRFNGSIALFVVKKQQLTSVFVVRHAAPCTAQSSVQARRGLRR